MPVGDYEYDDETQKMRINFLGSIYGESIEDYRTVMAITIDKLMELKKVPRLVIAGTREYEYDFHETRMLVEIANAIDAILRQKIINLNNIVVKGCESEAQLRFSFLQQLLNDLRYDPLDAYKQLLREMRRAKIRAQREQEFVTKACYTHYINSALAPLKELLEKCKMIEIASPYLADHKDRALYRKLFHPTVRPNFIYTRYISMPPPYAELLQRYAIGDTEVQIYKVPGKIRFLYHIIPPEFRLNEEEYTLLDRAREYLGRHEPREGELTEPERVRENLFRIGLDLLRDMRPNMPEEQLTKLANILTRYTAGLGIIDLVLQDENVQDIAINSPVGRTPIFIFHGNFQECETNVIPSREDAESWATRFRLMSGRPLDEANPVLDTELSVPGGRARIAAITRTLSPDGLGFALRRHRDKPWTYPLFIKNKFIDPFSAGLMWFLVDGARTLLIAGTRSSGKTSFLNATMVQIMPKIRIISVEDTLELSVEQLRELGYNIERLKARSVITHIETELPADEALRTALRLGDSALIIGEVRSSIRGDQEVLVIENGITKRIQIKELEGKNIKNYSVPILGFDLKANIKPLAGFVKHPKRDKLLEITTKTGKKVTVTHDHCLFTATKDFRIEPIECKDLKPRNKIVLPSSIPCGFNDIESINLLDLLQDFRLENFEADTRRAIGKLGWKKATEAAQVTSGDIYNYFRTAPNQQINLPVSSFKNLMEEAEIEFDQENLRITRGTGNSIPVVIPVNDDLCRFLGYYLSEGYYELKEGEGGNVILTNSDPKVLSDMVNLSKKVFGIEPKLRKVYGAGESTQLRLGSVALAALISKLNCGRTCTEKRVPSFVFGLKKEKIAAFLRGLYTGDGSFTASNRSGNCVRYFSTSKKLVEDVSYLLLVFGIVGTIRFRKVKKGNDIWCVEFKDREMVEKFLKEVGFERKVPEMLIRKWTHTKANSIDFDKGMLRKHLTKYPRRYRHLFRFLRCSKYYLKKVVNDPSCKASDRLKEFANGDFFLDEVKEVKEINLEEPEFVYDLSVEPSQNFIGGFGGILLHNTEASALYEAMRIGALANVVAGTIHGDSAYGVFDRVVNDLGVPPTSFKATDIILIANMLKSADGLRSFRRAVEITEVRKHWKSDPAEEGGFVNLAEYSAKDDTLKPTKTFLAGESMVIDDIASRVREWRGRWDAIWENINLRAKILGTLAAHSEKKPYLVEAPSVIESNSQFHIISQQVRDEVGALDSKMIYEQWMNWLKTKL